jgi:ribosomal protein L18
MMNQKKINRIRRGKRIRLNIREAGKISLIVNKTPQHTYAQIVSADGSRVLASVSTLQSDVRQGLNHTANIEAAVRVGRIVAEKAQQLGINDIVFDRSGFLYHGRVKALADAAREAGLKF